MDPWQERGAVAADLPEALGHGPWRRGPGVAAQRRSLRGPALKGEGALPALHFAPKAKRVIFLFMFGGPSHVELFDPKPKLTELQGQELPLSVRGQERFSTNTNRQDKLLLVGSPFGFARHGKSGMELSELLPHTGSLADDIALVRSVRTDSVNHDPAITLLQTGGLQPGRPTLGAWLSYGLGSMNRNLPEYVVLLSGGGGQPLRGRYWGQGFLPSNHQGVPLRPAGDPVLYVSNPRGMTARTRRQLLDGLRRTQRTAPRRGRRPGNCHPHRPV